jgi:hypothetical protein
MTTRVLTLAALLPIGLSSCMTMAPPPPPAGPCVVTEEARIRYAGVKFRERMRDAIEYETHSRISRVLRPGDTATMDFRPDRLNILLDDMNEISGLKCG